MSDDDLEFRVNARMKIDWIVIRRWRILASSPTKAVEAAKDQPEMSASAMPVAACMHLLRDRNGKCSICGTPADEPFSQIKKKRFGLSALLWCALGFLSVLLLVWFPGPHHLWPKIALSLLYPAYCFMAWSYGKGSANYIEIRAKDASDESGQANDEAARPGALPDL